ncbi:MAG: NAD(P)-dependent oxidoreductase, partial [Clostridia bacterium]
LGVERSGEDVFRHLCRVSCGAMSRIFGEDQIITQVKSAIRHARALGASDGHLEVLFRIAVTAAKKIKSTMCFHCADESVEGRIHRLVISYTQQPLRSVLVIGNGEMGRLAATSLLAAGLDVTMTLRSFRHGEAKIPEGVQVLAYEQRYAHFSEFDLLVSATRSPNYTIEVDELRHLSHYPKLMLDLAVPRDIEPAVRDLGITLYDIDQLGSAAILEDHAQQLREIDALIDKHYIDFLVWHTHHECFPKSAEEMPDGNEESLVRKTHFPLYVDLSGKTILVVGGGTIAQRRILTLCGFVCKIRVVAPEPNAKVRTLAENGYITLEERCFADADLEDIFLVVAATNERAVNAHICQLCRMRSIPVSIADCHNECTFYFPAIIQTPDAVIGVAGNSCNHKAVKKTAKRIREGLAYED